jgi:hypothetical protein
MVLCFYMGGLTLDYHRWVVVVVVMCGGGGGGGLCKHTLRDTCCITQPALLLHG